jgi:hypothetical protein
MQNLSIGPEDQPSDARSMRPEGELRAAWLRRPRVGTTEVLELSARSKDVGPSPEMGAEDFSIRSIRRGRVRLCQDALLSPTIHDLSYFSNLETGEIAVCMPAACSANTSSSPKAREYPRE